MMFSELEKNILRRGHGVGHHTLYARAGAQNSGASQEKHPGKPDRKVLYFMT
jgi:hypothetical protein